MFIPDILTRIDFLTKISEGLLKNKEIIQTSYCQESNLTKDRFEAEFTRTILQIENFIDWLQNGELPIPSIDYYPEKGIDLRKTYLPIGKVLVFGASNFPLAYSTIGGDVVSAFAAGCSVVFKAHPYHPETGQKVAAIIEKAIEEVNLPYDWFIFEDGPIAKAEEWVLHPTIKAIGFTGSKEIGLHIQKLVQQRKTPIPVFAEMGSLNPIFVFPFEANNERWANEIATAISSNAGQFCTKPGLIFIFENESSKAFEQQLSSNIEQAKRHPFLHSTIKKRFLASLNQTQLTSTKDLEIAEQDKALIKTISFSEFETNSNLLEECFGPFAIVVQCKNREEILKGIEKLEGQLSGALFCQDLHESKDIISKLQFKVGRIIHNQVTTGVHPLPSMHHGGPFPATNESRFTAVGTDSVLRFLTPITYQNFPQEMLPKELQNKNQLHKLRRINQKLCFDSI